MIWSIAATCQAATTNPAGLFVCRLFIGIGEAGFGQAVPFCELAAIFHLFRAYSASLGVQTLPTFTASTRLLSALVFISHAEHLPARSVRRNNKLAR